MTLHLFVNVVTLGNDFTAIAKGIGSSSVIWMTLKARTNGFVVSNQMNALDGYRIAEGSSMDIPISDLIGKLDMFKLDSLYWKNTTSGSNAIVEIIGMRDV
jgi:hypothetical protein